MTCPFIRVVGEGLRLDQASKLTGIRGENIELNSSVWDVQAYYIAQAAGVLPVTFRPKCDRGGGVMAQQHMLDRVREVTALLNGYLPVLCRADYIVLQQLQAIVSATLGNFVLAKVSQK